MIRAVRGVSDVSQDSPIDIGPPGGDNLVTRDYRKSSSLSP